MATRKKAKPAAKPKPKAKAKAKPKAKPTNKLECRVCGYRVIVDETCGCSEEHVLICCSEPMAKK
jgi:ribosomal protein L44E